MCDNIAFGRRLQHVRVAIFLTLGQHIDIYDELRKDAVMNDSSNHNPTSMRSDSMMSYGEDLCNENTNTEALSRFKCASYA